MNLPQGDKTPKDFVINNDVSFKEECKKVIRKYVYPVYNSIRNKSIEKEFSFIKQTGINNLFLGQRGTDYEALRERVDKIKNIKDSVVLIIGIGTGRDLESWLKYNPKKIIAIDYFSYDKAWKMRIEQYKNGYNTEIQFLQADIVNLKSIENDSIDIVGSDAVFEHINKFSDAIKELKRVLVPDGILYANFGPLWYSWGGDHISGTENTENAYNHIRLDKDNYYKYLDTFGEFTHSEHDGRTWIKNNLFSYLKPKEYLDIIESHGLNKLFTSCVIDEKAIDYKKQYPEIYNELVLKFGEENLLISGITIIYVKK